MVHVEEGLKSTESDSGVMSCRNLIISERKWKALGDWPDGEDKTGICPIRKVITGLMVA